jgi:hypothetical protein
VLRQSESRPVAESAFLADHTFLYKLGFRRNFAIASPETSYTKNVTNELNFLLVAHTTCFDIRFGRHGILISGSISGRFWTGWHTTVWSGFWATKEGETCWGLKTKTEDNKLIFQSITQTHVFDKHNNGYGHLSTVRMRSSLGGWNLISQRLEVLPRFRMLKILSFTLAY